MNATLRTVTHRGTFPDYLPRPRAGGWRRRARRALRQDDREERSSVKSAARRTQGLRFLARSDDIRAALFVARVPAPFRARPSGEGLPGNGVAGRELSDHDDLMAEAFAYPPARLRARQCVKIVPRVGNDLLRPVRSHAAHGRGEITPGGRRGSIDLDAHIRDVVQIQRPGSQRLIKPFECRPVRPLRPPLLV